MCGPWCGETSILEHHIIYVQKKNTSTSNLGSQEKIYLFGKQDVFEKFRAYRWEPIVEACQNFRYTISKNFMGRLVNS